MPERGAALPSLLAALSLAAVVLAAGAFVLTGPAGSDGPAHARRAADRPALAAAPSPAGPSPQVQPSSTPSPRHEKRHHHRVDRRGDVYVEVYNNSRVSGLAGRTAERMRGAGWEVVGSDNWYGTIPTSTVYYPHRLKDEARLLGRDLGVHRMRPAISPMKFDRLTVILTDDYA